MKLFTRLVDWAMRYNIGNIILSEKVVEGLCFQGLFCSFVGKISPLKPLRMKIHFNESDEPHMMIERTTTQDLVAADDDLLPTWRTLKKFA